MSTHTPHPATAPESISNRARRQRRKGSRTVLDDEADDITWLYDGYLSALSEKHRKIVMWALDTCNTNAWSGAKEYLAKSKADLIAVQEAKIAKTELADTEQTTRISG